MLAQRIKQKVQRQSFSCRLTVHRYSFEGGRDQDGVAIENICETADVLCTPRVRLGRAGRRALMLTEFHLAPCDIQLGLHVLSDNRKKQW